MQLALPPNALVLLIGASGSGKSTFARQHFRGTEIISSDHCRALVSDDEADQSASQDAFEIVYLIANKRLARGKLTVIDATNAMPEWRKPYLEIARAHGATPVAIVFDLPLETLLRHNAMRPGRTVHPAVIEKQAAAVQASLASLVPEGFSTVHRITQADAH